MPAPVKLDENHLKRLFIYENRTQDEIASIMGVNRHTIMRRINKLGLVRCFMDKEWLMEQHYNNRLTITRMAELAYCNADTITKYMQHHGLKAKFYKKHNYDYDYFKSIDNPNKAYWLGFIVADGGLEVSSNNSRSIYRLRILLSDKDHYHLEKFASEISGTLEVKRGETALKGRLFGHSVLSINSREIVESLIDIGVYPNKSAKEQMPDMNYDYISDFIRGHFDGDGCFSYWYSREDLQQELSFLGSRLLMEQFNIIIQQHLNIKGAIAQDGKMFKLRFTAINDVNALIKWMYQNDLYLERKHQKIQEWISLRLEKGNSLYHPHVDVKKLKP